MERPMVVIDLQQEPRLARDLTAGGVYVNGCELAINSECSLVVRGPSDELCLTARVVFVDGNRGAGLELVGFGAAMRAQLSALVAAPAPSPQASDPAIPRTMSPREPASSDPAIARTMSPREPAIPRTSSPRGTDPPLSRTRTPVRAADDDGHVARTRTPPGGSDRRALLDQLDLARTRTARADEGLVDPARTRTERATSSPSIAIPRTQTPFDEPDTPPEVRVEGGVEDAPVVSPGEPETDPPIAIARTRARSSEQPPAQVDVVVPLDVGALDDAPATLHDEAPGWISARTAPGPVWTGDDLMLVPDDAPPPSRADTHDDVPRPDSTERIPLSELLADEPVDTPFELELELLPPAEQPSVGRVITDEIQTMDEPVRTAEAEPAAELAVELAEERLPEAEIDPAELGGEGDEKKRLSLNHYERLRGLTLAQAIKKATSVDPGERMILERIYGKSVWEPLLRNPRLTPPEVARIARMGALPRPLLELITSNGAWLQVGEVRRALLSNPRLGTDQILRILRLIPKHELKLVASQTVYPHPVRDAAKRLVKEMGA